MSVSVLSLAAIAKAATPLIKDLYDGAKGEARNALKKWDATTFPRKFARKISQIDTVRTIWSPEENVSLRKFYYPCKIHSRGEASITVEAIADLGEGCVVVQGIVGQGKSILLRYLALQEIIRLNNKRLPVFLELRKISKSVSLIDLIKKTLSSYDIDVDDYLFKYLASLGKIVLLLDGFDELDASVVNEVTIDIEGLALHYPDMQIIVSSRPSNEIQKLGAFRVLEIEPLQSEDYSKFLRVLGLKVTKISDIVHAIEASPSNVSALITTPLMLTLVVFVYQSEKQIPVELPEFFEKLFYTVFTRHDKLKAAFERQHYSGLSERKLQILFEAFCFMSLQLGSGRTLKPALFSEAFELAQDYVDGAKCDEVSFKKDITKVACLMLEEGLGEVTFLHKSIAEYHAAAFVKTSDDVFVERFYTEAYFHWEPWRECLRFLSNIDSYRYSKYFAIRGISNVIPVFEKLAECNSKSDIVAALPLWIRQVKIIYREEPDGKYYCSLFGSWTSAGSLYETELCDTLSRVIFRVCPNVLKDEVFTELREEGVHVVNAGNNEVQIAFADAVFYWGMDDFKNEMSTGVEQLKLRLSEAERLAEKLEKRALIFERKSK